LSFDRSDLINHLASFFLLPDGEFTLSILYALLELKEKDLKARLEAIIEEHYEQKSNVNVDYIISILKDALEEIKKRLRKTNPLPVPARILYRIELAKDFIRSANSLEPWLEAVEPILEYLASEALKSE